VSLEDRKEHTMPKQGASAALMPEPLQTFAPQVEREQVMADQRGGMNHELPDQQAEQQELATFAYLFWQERGCPEGSPDEDWYRAVRERQLRSMVP
jgi:hypothetical protein